MAWLRLVDRINSIFGSNLSIYLRDMTNWLPGYHGKSKSGYPEKTYVILAVGKNATVASFAFPGAKRKDRILT